MDTNPGSGTFLMTTAKDRSPNPLRPYYVPPSVGPAPSSTTAQSPHTARPHPAGARGASGSIAGDLFPEFDLDFKTSAGEAWSASRQLFDALLYKYLSVLLAQPFDVAKTVLQLSLPPSADAGVKGQRRRASPRRSGGGYGSRSRRDRPYDDAEGDEGAEDEETGDESDDVPDYFSSTAPRSRSPRRRRRTPPSEEELSPTPTPSKHRRDQDATHDYRLYLKRQDSLLHAMSALYNTSGGVGLWRSTNCTFLYSVLLRTTDTFLRSLLLALLGLPEIPGPDPSGLGSALNVQGGMGLSGLDLSDSPNAFGSLVVVGLSSCIAGLLLSPLDQIRTRLIATPTSHQPRGLLQNLRHLPSLLAPNSLWLPTALAHSIPQVFSASMPLMLRRQLKFSPEATPGLWSFSAFCTCLTDLFIRLPLETIERRAQIHALKRADPLMPTIIEPAPYAGVGGTVYSILYQEGETRIKDPRTGMIRIKRGQGVAGLVRGWRVGFWGLVGVWGAGAMGPGEGKGRGEF
ncbi:hypothetical protein B0A50_06346 [Salinomyces thailandicus]|uniref:Mitochondrial fusion protein n=1 Tax=Salinomyces thailandicus TaxID=706561 RepID=A0A4U0TRP3_9PEZI|nr:hypothetical protein B0A50_06346 [Salinomyces thailandica]